jgi:predicted Ser/Thr protein kinase
MTHQLGRYTLLEEIGRGGFAVVYRAIDSDLGRQVALKELKPFLLQDQSWVERFYREARAVARLDHPRIVTVYDVGEIEGRLFITMRVVNGPSLEDQLSSQGRQPWPQAVETFTAIAQGLDYAHAQGILHRDLKPANILLDPERGPLLTDFGLAKLTGDSSTSLTASGSVIGTPHYIAPEVWEGQGSTAAADIYALGCILFELITGEKVFKGETPPAVMMAHFKPLSLPAVWPQGVPPGVAGVLRRALAANPANRYQTAATMAADLAALPASAALEPVPALAKPAPTPPPAAVEPPPTHVDIPRRTRPLYRRRGCVWSSVILLLVAGLLVGLGLGGMCSAVSGIAAIGKLLDTFLPTVAVGPTQTMPILVAGPAQADAPVEVDIEFGNGKLNISPGAKTGLIEGEATFNVAQFKPVVFTNSTTVRLQQQDPLKLARFTEGAVENRWNLALGAAPISLSLSAGLAEAKLELGGLSLTKLDINQGAANFELAFSEPNRAAMSLMDVQAGAAKTTLRGLANSRAAEIVFDGKLGEHTLDFSGQLQNDIRVRAVTNLSHLVIIVPENSAAEVTVTSESPTVEVKGGWQKSGDKFTNPGEGPRITIDVSLNAGSLELRNL